MSDMLSPLERNLTLQIERLLQQHSERIEELEARVRQLEDERAELTTMMNLWHALQTPLRSSPP
ncbi:hypothetical protein [Paracoccus yeei]|jgi:chromosome segregation ATPase|uniref:Uncharacterized protein n=1 Tax=Paracoccus yeei TaxID=147645 RepID=A0A2D2C705_9RHOB|nr:hypothetical protein [Paracoccus yeei]ATQ58294.1 hypothetical protein PYTT13_20935 [Paracoccus yeei]MBY0135092.1 hypothetical protein [Paracoccus yeei]